MSGAFELGAVALAQAIARGELSAGEALADSLARIDATDARVNAFTDRTAERARREARAVDDARLRGDALGPLAGVPYAVKNLFDIAGVTTRAGSRVLQDDPPAARDAVLVQRLRDA